MPHAVYTAAALDLRLHERLDRHPYYTLADRVDALRMVSALWQAATGTWPTTVAAPVIPEEPYVPVPGIEQVLAVRWQGIPLLPTTVEELGFIAPGWRTQVVGSAGARGLQRPYYWAPIGHTTVALWPVPDIEADLVCTGLGAAPDFPPDNMALPIDVAPAWVDGFLDLAAWWCAGKAGVGTQDQFQPHLDRGLAAMAALSDLQDASKVFWQLRQGLAGRQLRLSAPPSPGGEDAGASATPASATGGEQ